MSKIGKVPVELKENVTVTTENRVITVNGPKGTLTFALPLGIKTVVEDGKVLVSMEENSMEDLKALYGLTRANIANMVEGVSSGFERKLELTGVGFRAQSTGTDLTLSLGFSHPVKFKAPDGVTFKVEENIITIAGIDKGVVGNTAATIRKVRPPEPYKGKGISYKGERIRRKAGKSAKAVGAK